MKKFFITTPIYYVNDEPHIGHAYTTVAADVFARYYREKLGEKNVFFLTGTDEHGEKVAQAATKQKKSPKEYADEISEKFKSVWKLLNIKYDYFIRTTDPEHEKIVQQFLQKIYDNGYVYKGVYKGLYCVGCERFLSEDELVDGACPLHPNIKPIYKEEENYFLKLKELSEKALKEIQKGTYKILPQERKNEIVSKIKAGVNDVSISRFGIKWGIPLPWDKEHIVYVWIDALLNYYSATKIAPEKATFWPPDLQLLAKDILWFHALLWEALLIAAEEKLPETIFAHGFFTIDGQKMSKSLGNVISPKQLIDAYGVDGARYLLLTAFPFGNDGDVSLKKFTEKYNADLANGLGNLIARTAKLGERLDNNPYKRQEAGGMRHEDFNGVEKKIINYQPEEALKIIWNKIKDADKKFNEEKPWELENEKLEIVLKDSIKEIIEIAVNLKPFMPQTAEKIIEIFRAEKIESPSPLFPRK